MTDSLRRLRRVEERKLDHAHDNRSLPVGRNIGPALREDSVRQRPARRKELRLSLPHLLRAALVGIDRRRLPLDKKIQTVIQYRDLSAFCEIFRVIFNNSKALHGAAGLSVTYHPDVTQMQFTSRSGYLYMAFVMVAAITFALWKLRKSKTGLYFIAIRENEDAAKALGINAFRYKMVALIASAMLSAVAGTFYAQYYLTIDPTIVFSNTVSSPSIKSKTSGSKTI